MTGMDDEHPRPDEDAHIVANPTHYHESTWRAAKERQAERRGDITPTEEALPHEIVNARTLQRNQKRYVDLAAGGTTVVITVSGEPRARIVPLDHPRMEAKT